MSDPLQHLKEVHGEKNFAARPSLIDYNCTSGLESVGSSAMVSEIDYDYVVRLDLQWRKRVKRGMPSTYFVQLRREAERAIADELYGDFIQRLRRTYYELGKAGVRDDELNDLWSIIDDMGNR